MGHFSYNCKLSGLPITGGTPAVLIVMKPVDNLHDYSDENLRKYGHSHQCSNDTTMFKFKPVWFPIKGYYDDYGGLEGIQENDNTKLLEKEYGLPIQDIVNIVTCSRKDDGYSDVLKPIKVKKERPADQLKGEKHFDYYQRTMNDPMPCNGVYPDVEDDYGKPEYKEEYKELLSYSAMWVHGDFYKKLTDKPKSDAYDRLDYGRPELLDALGFVEGEKTDDPRYNRPFTHGKLTVISDGNNLQESIYTLDSFKKLADDIGEDIDFSPLEGNDKIEQIYDIVLPRLSNDNYMRKAVELFQNDDDDELKEYYESVFPNEEISFKEFLHKLLRSALCGFTREEQQINNHFLNFNEYRFINPMTKPYIQCAKNGGLKDDVVRFWRFNYYMYACGRYYDIVGTSPQDGERDDVLEVLSVASSVLIDELSERE